MLTIILGGTMFVLALGVPVAFGFILINVLGVLILQGGGGAFHSLTLSMYDSVSTFVLLPIPLFILMGEILWHSRVAFHAVDVIDRMLGRLPGRLSILAVLSGTVFSSLSGSTMATTAVLGTILGAELLSGTLSQSHVTVGQCNNITNAGARGSCERGVAERDRELQRQAEQRAYQCGRYGRCN